VQQTSSTISSCKEIATVVSSDCVAMDGKLTRVDFERDKNIRSSQYKIDVGNHSVPYLAVHTYVRVILQCGRSRLKISSCHSDASCAPGKNSGQLIGRRWKQRQSLYLRTRF